MKLLKTKIKGPKILKTNFFNDQRGSLKEIYRKNVLKKEFLFDIMSKSKKKCFKRPAYTIKKSTSKVNNCNKR